ncbi:MAG: hypothetical protein IJ356_01255 [Erysipelotrichaceae bacterium]|nr:hypothetical protein [Erysipelotrichaceae bacterium]
MEMLKKYFPFSFTEKKDIAAVIVNVLLHIVAGWVIGIVLGIAGILPVIGWVTGLAGALVEVYLFAGMVLSVLDYLKLLK